MDRSAYHEAGHAYMAMYVGARVVTVTIDPESGDLPDRFGDTHVEWTLRGMTKREFAERAIWVALAGPAVEIIYSGDPYHPGLVEEWSDDWNEAVHQSKTIARREKDQLAFLEDTMLRLIGMLKQDRHWSPVAALADHLLAHETLETHELEGIVRNWLR